MQKPFFPFEQFNESTQLYVSVKNKLDLHFVHALEFLDILQNPSSQVVSHNSHILFASFTIIINF